MRNLEIKGTLTTPDVSLNATTGEMKFSGRSIPEDPSLFFGDIFSWIEEFFQNNNQEALVEFELEYINSGSSKYFFEIIKLIDQYFKKGNSCKITWLYEEDDESIMELGELYQGSLEVPFVIREI